MAGPFVSTALLGATQTFAANPEAPVVLVHGALYCGWCWRKLLPVLRRAGRETFASTLTGLGERSHLLTAEIDLTAHINDIVWAQSRLGDQPIQTFTQPVVISSQIIIPKTHIQCSEAPFFKEAATRAKEQGFRYHDLLSAGHEAMITRPEELAQILLQV